MSYPIPSEAERLSSEQFTWVCYGQERVTIPPVYCFSKDPLYRQYVLPVSKFVASGVHALWYASHDRLKWLNPILSDGAANPAFDFETSKPIQFSELENLEILRHSKMDELRVERKNRPERTVPHAIALPGMRSKNSLRW